MLALFARLCPSGGRYLDYILYALRSFPATWRPCATAPRGSGRRRSSSVPAATGWWHSGSPMAGIIHLVRGMCVFVPRNMTLPSDRHARIVFLDEDVPGGASAAMLQEVLEKQGGEEVSSPVEK
jgi:hypothetical protein